MRSNPEVLQPARIPTEPTEFGTEARTAVLAVLQDGGMTSGAFVEAFETAFAGAHQASHGVATSSGTAALIVALLGLGIGPGDEVVLPSLTFFGTVEAVLAVGARPVFADIDPGRYCLDPQAAAAAVTPQTAAILPVHLYGQPADRDALAAVCRRHGLALVEDAAQAHGARIADRPVGAQGIACFSFYPSKAIKTGQGGMVLTDDAALADRLRQVRNHGLTAPGEHRLLGGNYQMGPLPAAVGATQVGRLAEHVAARAANASWYGQRLRRVLVPEVAEGVTHAWHLYTVRVGSGVDRDQAVAKLQARGVPVRVYYAVPAHRQPLIQQRFGSIDRLVETDQAAREVLSLPVHPGLRPRHLARVVEAVEATC